VMSVFHRQDNAGSVAWASVAAIVAARGRWTLVDCGFPITAHFQRFGAVAVPEDRMCELVLEGLAPSTQTCS
jgi:Leu/Phe-tRNA-protein transferase